MTQPTALWLADWLGVNACGGDNWNAKMNAAAAELRRQHKEIKVLRAALAAVRFQCEADAKAGEWTTSITKLLDALRGPATELVSWSWHDLPERAAALVAQRDALLEALKEARWRIANLVGAEGAQGLDRKALDKIDAAIKAVEEGK